MRSTRRDRLSIVQSTATDMDVVAPGTTPHSKATNPPRNANARFGEIESERPDADALSEVERHGSVAAAGGEMTRQWQES
jgi:hypothetical protein